MEFREQGLVTVQGGSGLVNFHSAIVLLSFSCYNGDLSQKARKGNPSGMQIEMATDTWREKSVTGYQLSHKSPIQCLPEPG